MCSDPYKNKSKFKPKYVHDKQYNLKGELESFYFAFGLNWKGAIAGERVKKYQ